MVKFHNFQPFDSHLNNSESVKFIHVLCDPVHRSFSHFLHMFEVQAKENSDRAQVFLNMIFINYIIYVDVF